MPAEAPFPDDEPRIKQLLVLCELPQEDITSEHLHHFLILKEKREIIGVVGVEVLGRFGLLRSLAVHPKWRHRGFGLHLIERAEEYAASLRIEALYLLTMTAEGFFARRGYQRVERTSVPARVQATAEFRSLCPVTAVCLVKHFKPHPFGQSWPGGN